ncbi:MAG TPA: glycosyltransferase [Elusimicrobia bacterium]|nr:glycosyltransferase [Elusimicrobiota bacterium]
MKLISIVTHCFNEEGNVGPLYTRVREIFQKLGTYRYEHIFIDNASTDGTQAALKKLAASDSNVKVILNTRNFGVVRSAYHGFLQAGGDAVIPIAADLQDPPELINDFLREWKKGSLVVLGIKNRSEEPGLMFAVRKLYYKIIGSLAEIKINQNSTGFGLYDRKTLVELKKWEDPYPFFRGLVSELGFEPAKVEYSQPVRKRGVSTNNFYTLYDMGVHGLISHSKVPLRLAIFIGFFLAIVNLIVALGYFVYKLLYWNSFSMGIAPAVIGLFFFSSVQLIFLGILGEYIAAIYTQTRKRPLVIEKERINF